MLNTIRGLLWKILGIRYYKYLRGKNCTYLKDVKWAIVGENTHDSGAIVWKWYNYSILKIGKCCSIGSNVNLICDSGYHTESEFSSFSLFFEILREEDDVIIKNKTYRVSDIKEKIKPKKCNIEIGNDVWIGINSTIMPGVKIGNGVTVLTGSIITKDIPDYSLVGGNPAKIIKMKHTDEVIDKLNQIAWWDWSNKKLKENINDFYLSTEEFIKKHS